MKSFFCEETVIIIAASRAFEDSLGNKLHPINSINSIFFFKLLTRPRVVDLNFRVKRFASGTYFRP